MAESIRFVLSGLTFELRFADDVLRGEDDQQAHGLSHASDQLIVLSGDQTEDHQRATCLHELIHVVDCVPTPAGYEGRLSEAQVARIAIGLFAVLTGNPKMTRWLFAGNHVYTKEQFLADMQTPAKD